MTLAAIFKRPFTEQLDYFRQKANLSTQHWDDILGNAHDRSFIVAGAMKADLLADLRAAVDKSISQGASLQQFRADFAAIVQQHGWTDYQGEFGWRTKVIYETNMRASYAAGRYAQLTDPDLLAARPFWRYVHDDSVLHPRPVHVSWDGLVLKHDDPWWKAHFPLGGWGCRCRVVAVSRKEAQAADKTSAPDDGTWRYTDRWGKVHVLPRGINYGWQHTPGATWKPDLRRYPPEIAAALRRDIESGSISGMSRPKRAPWVAFPDVVLHAAQSAVKRHPVYDAAKAGNVEAALRLADELADSDAIDRLAALGATMLAAVHAVEGSGVNVIPLALAGRIEAQTGLKVTSSIVQANRVGHTGATGWARLARPALFSGEVERGARYVLVDDFVGQGGTLANLRGYIESRGGVVVATTALTGRSDSAILTLRASTLDALRRKHGGETEEWWRKRFGYGFELLTESEARYLLRAEDADTIRNRVTAGALQDGA